MSLESLDHEKRVNHLVLASIDQEQASKVKNEHKKKPHHGAIHRCLVLLRDESKEVWSEATMHGLARVIKSKNWFLKVIWTLCILTCMGWFFYFMISNIMQFYKYEVSTSIEEVDETPATFPTITICNKYPLTTDVAIEIMQATIGAFNLTNALNASELSNLTALQRHTLFEQVTSYTLNEALTTLNSSGRSLLGRSLNDLLIECYFNDVPCNVENDFVWYFDRVYGKVILVCSKYLIVLSHSRLLRAVLS